MTGRECDGIVKANPLVSITLVASLVLGWSLVAGAQSGWPDAKKPDAKASSPKATKEATPKAARTTPRTKRKPASAKTPPPGVASSQLRAADETALRVMSEIIARQTLAIEVLTRRVEATERRLAVTARDPEMAAVSGAELIAESADVFRAALFVDWDEVIDGLSR
jgi:hypothetical protein